MQSAVCFLVDQEQSTVCGLLRSECEVVYGGIFPRNQNPHRYGTVASEFVSERHNGRPIGIAANDLDFCSAASRVLRTHFNKRKRRYILKGHCPLGWSCYCEFHRLPEGGL